MISTSQPDVKAHPRQAMAGLMLCAVMLPVIIVFLAWYRRRKQAEFDEVSRILSELKN